VRIACDGEVCELDKPKFEPMHLKASDPLFRAADAADADAISELSRFIGLPLAGRKERIDAYYWQVSLHNAEAAALFRNCDLSTPERGSREGSRDTAFGAVRARWLADTGPVIVARVDRRPLHPLHVAAAAAFCGRYLRRPFQDCIDAEDDERDSGEGAKADVADRRRQVLALATPGRFADFFEQYKARRVRGRRPMGDHENAADYMRRMEKWSFMEDDEMEVCPEWEDVPSPFDV
jgi:hypothetical protein